MKKEIVGIKLSKNNIPKKKYLQKFILFNNSISLLLKSIESTENPLGSNDFRFLFIFNKGRG